MPRNRPDLPVRERVAVLETSLHHVNEKLATLIAQSATTQSELSEVKSETQEIRTVGTALVKFVIALLLFYVTGGSDSETLAGALKALFPSLFGGP